jgi:hypothetical protein
MESVNEVTLVGNLTRNPEMKHTKGKKPICIIGLATNRHWTDENGHHVATGDGEWEFQAVSDFLYRWADIFNLEFFGRLLPPPVISFEPCRIEVLGYFFPGRNDQGLKFNINLNQQWLRLPEAELLEILLHEQIHLEQQVTGTAGKGNYHNKKFQQKAADVGLKVELGRGCHLGSPTDPFVALLKAHGVSFTPRESVVELPKPEKDKRRLRRWSCSCKSVWCGGDLKAKCLNCKEQFRPNPKRGG